MIVATLRYVVGSQKSAIDPPDVEMIESGAAYVRRNAIDVQPLGPVYFDEPLVIASIIMKYAEDDISWTKDLAGGAMHNSLRGFQLQTELTLLIMHHFGGHYTRLGYVFDFGGSEIWSKLKDKKMTLVGVLERDGKYYSYSSSWKKAPALPFGYQASSAKDLAEALEICSGVSFFFLDNKCGPDMIFMLRDEETKEVTPVILQATFMDGVERKRRGKVTMEANTFYDAVNTTEPMNLYRRENKVRYLHAMRVFPLV